MADPKTLYEYYGSQGKSLPGVSDRFSDPTFAAAATAAGITPETYSADAKTNTAILNNLIKGTTTAQSTQTTSSSAPAPTSSTIAGADQGTVGGNGPGGYSMNVPYTSPTSGPSARYAPDEKDAAGNVVRSGAFLGYDNGYNTDGSFGPSKTDTSPLTSPKSAVDQYKDAYSAVLPQYQGAIDAAKGYFANLITDAKSQGERNAGATRAQNAAFGLMGSPEASTAAGNVTRATEQSVSKLRAQQEQEISAILNEVNTNAMELAKTQASQDQTSAQNAITLRDKARTDAEKAITTFAKNPNFDLEMFKTLPEYKSLVDHLGRGSEYVDAVFMGSVPPANVVKTWTEGSKMYQLVQTPGGKPKVMSFDVGEEIPKDWETKIDSKGNFIAYDKNDPTNVIIKQIGSSPSGSSAVQIPAGSIASTHNNPLNIKVGTSTQAYIDNGAATVGQAGQDGGNFLKFNSAEEGLAAATALLFSPVYNNLTVDQAMKKWSNNGYGGEITPDLKGKTINELVPDEQKRLISAMARRESGTVINNLGSKGDEILSVTEAKTLKVPYGTTRAQAAGLVPGQKVGEDGVLQMDTTTQRQIASQYAATKQINKELTDLKALYDKYGNSKVLPGNAKTELKNKVAIITAAIKDAETLGTLDAGVSKLVEQLIGGPGSVDALFTDSTTAKNQLDQVAKYLNGKLDNKASIYGAEEQFGSKTFGGESNQANSVKDRATAAGYDYDAMRQQYTDEQIDAALNAQHASTN